MQVHWHRNGAVGFGSRCTRVCVHTETHSTISIVTSEATFIAWRLIS
jgi:hypothetical protein